MKIGIDARLAQQTGVGRYIKNLIQELQKIDKKNEYIVFARSEEKKLFSEQDNFQVVDSNHRWHTLSEQTGFLAQLNSHKLDLMHFTYFSHPILYKRPFVVTMHDLIIYHHKTGEASTKNPLIYNLKHKAYKYAVKSAAENATHILVPSHAVKRDIMSTLSVREEKVTVTYEGVDALPTEEKIDVPEKYMLYVGNAYPHKNVQFLIDAFVQFRLSHDDAQLILVGPEDHFFKKLRLDSHVQVRHNVTDSQLSYLYGHALSLIQPSHSEGFGLTTLEALQKRCPVLASDIPVFREILNTHATYFDPQKEQSLLEGLKGVYNLKAKEKKERADNAKKYIQKYKWSKTAKETKQVYESSHSL